MTDIPPDGSIGPSRRGFLKKTAAGVGAAFLAAGPATARARQDQTAPQTIATFDPPNLPENIAIDQQGNHYLSMAPPGEIWVVPTDGGSPRSLASVPLGGDDQGEILLGIAMTDDGEGVFACVNSQDPTTHGVWRVPLGEGNAEHVASMPPGESTVNGITDRPLPDGSRLVTDHTKGAIWRVSGQGDAEVWLDDSRLDPNPYASIPVGVDGIEIGPNGDVWVDNLSFGSLLRVPVKEDGSAGKLEVFLKDDALVGSDGLTLDREGNIYVAVNAKNRIVRVTQDKQVETLVEGGNLDFPADVHFGQTEQTRTNLFFVNFALPSAQAEDKQANPSYMMIDVGVPGVGTGG